MGYAHPLPDGTVPAMDADSSVSRNHGLSGVTGGSLPAEIWRKFMRAATDGVDSGTFHDPTSFPGRILNDSLAETTTTASTSSTTTSSTTSSTSTTVPDTTSSTTTSSTTSTSSTTTTTPPIIN